MKRITFKDGPRNGSTVDVPDEYTAIAYPGGEYRVKGATATWKAHKGTKGASADVVAADEVKQYDEGGTLPEGTTLVENKSGTIPDGKVSVVTNGGGKPEAATKPRRTRK